MSENGTNNEMVQLESSMPDGSSVENRQELDHILDRFVKTYTEKSEEQTDEEWLRGRLLTELPELSEDIANRQSQEAVKAIQAYDENLASLLQARSRGKTDAEWFSEHMQQSFAGIPDAEYTARLTTLYISLEQVTAQPGEAASEVLTAPSVHETPNLTKGELQLLTKATGRQVMKASAQSALQFAEYVPRQLQRKSVTSVETQKAVAYALTTGKDKGLKTAATGALAVAAKKQIIAAAQEEMPMAVYANLACMSVENVKVSMQVADHIATETEAGGRIIANAAIAVTNMVCRATGILVSLPVSKIPVIGTFAAKLGEACGNAVAEAAGPKIEEKVRKANGPIANHLKRAVKNASDAANLVKKEIKNKMKSFAKKLFG